MSRPSSIVHRRSSIVMALTVLSVPAYAQNDARQIVEEAQRRTEAKSERYEGLLRVIDAKGKIADKRWIFVRLGSHGNSKAVLRFIAPPK